jgi:hypothetical protein
LNDDLKLLVDKGCSAVLVLAGQLCKRFQHASNAPRTKAGAKIVRNESGGNSDGQSSQYREQV